MRLTQHDRTLSLSSTEADHKQRKYTPNNSLGDTYSKVSRFPGRVVKAETAYGRLRRDPSMSIEDACLTPSKQQRSSKIKQVYGHRKLIDQTPPGYVDELHGKEPSTHIAKRWELEPTTVRRHRKLLNEEQQP